MNKHDNTKNILLWALESSVAVIGAALDMEHPLALWALRPSMARSMLLAYVAPEQRTKGGKMWSFLCTMWTERVVILACSTSMSRTSSHKRQGPRTLLFSSEPRRFTSVISIHTLSWAQYTIPLTWLPSPLSLELLEPAVWS